jgi:hypothetical protein
MRRLLPSAIAAARRSPSGTTTCGLRLAGWRGGHYLDYQVAGNLPQDFPASAGFCPLVSVNPGSSELLLGWEVFKVGPAFVPISDFWLLKREGPLAARDVVARPDGKH